MRKRSSNVEVIGGVKREWRKERGERVGREE